MLRDRRTPLLLALLSLIAAYALWSAGWVRGLDAALLSLSFRLRGAEAPAPEVLIVGIDELSLQGTVDAEMSMRDIYADLLDRLRSADAQVIGLNVPLSTLYYAGVRRPAKRDHLDDAVRECGNVVLPCVLEPTDIVEGRPVSEPPARFSTGRGQLQVPRELEKGALIGPPKALAQGAAGIGHLNVYPDIDGAVRAVPLMTAARGKLWPSFALEVVRVSTGLPAGSASLVGRTVRLQDHSTKTSAAGEMMINFAGGYGHYPRVWLRDLLTADEQTVRERVKGKVVLVGPIGHSPYWRTPVHPVMPGVELTANAVGNLLHRHELRQVERAAVMLYALVVALIMGLSVSSSRALQGALVCAELVAATLLVMLFLFWRSVWLPVGVSLVATGVGGLALMIRTAAVADRRRVEAETSLDTRMDAIAGIGHLIVSSSDRRRLLESVVTWVERELETPAVSILLLDERRRRLEFEVASGEKGAEVKSFALALGEGVAGTVAATGMPLIIDAASQDPRHSRQISEAVGFPVSSIICVPIELHGQVIGVIEALNKHSGNFTVRDQKLLTVIAQQAALFLEANRLYSELQKRVDDATASLRRANRDLALQNAKLETLFEVMESGVIYADSRGLVVTWNRAAEALLGVVQGIAVGQPAVAVIDHPQLSAMFTAPLASLSAGQSCEVELEVGEKTVVLRASASVVDEEEGTGRLLLLTDITQLKELDRMKTDFVSFVSHELQNPLASIRGFAHLLQQKIEDDSPNARLIRVLNQQSSRMQWLVEDFLDISRIDSGSPLAVQYRDIEDPERMIQAIVDLYAITTQDHTFVVEVNDDTPVFQADRRKLEQVLVNLVGNAVKYSPDGGEVRITVEPVEDDVLFSVFDEGIGLTEDDVTHLFQRFRRAPGTRDRIPGTGIGLFLCRYLIEVQGGSIRGEQRPKGSVFRFSLPIHRSSPESDAR